MADIINFQFSEVVNDHAKSVQFQTACTNQPRHDV